MLMNVTRSDVLAIRSEYDIVLARQTARALCQELNFSLVEITKMVTAASEIARNTLIHGKGGSMRWELLVENGRSGLRLVFEDAGPGIADIGLAMSDGWTSGSGLGKGLPGTKRLVNDFDIQSQVGTGTRVSIVRWK
jgi:serine/threonine-protein kinase RsbT